MASSPGCCQATPCTDRRAGIVRLSRDLPRSGRASALDEKKLYQIIDFILNHAEIHELDVIRAALRKREGGDPSEDGSGATFGQNISKMASDMASQVRDQVGVSEEQVRNTVRGFVSDMLSREAPELRASQVEELLDEWVPGIGGKPKRRQEAAGGSAEGRLPSDVLLTMIRQFAAFGTGAMTVAEETSLDKAMQGWQQKYWDRFSSVTHKLITLYVKGVMSERDFWDGVYDELGLDANGAPSES